MGDNKILYVVLLLVIGYFIFKGSDTTAPITNTSINGTCQENTCNGIFTGVTDTSGCKIYGLELCSAETECKSIDGKRVCDPQPYVNGCTWKTATEFGKTQFTEFTDCGLNQHETCGTISKYRCTKDASLLCDLNYTKKADTFIKGCGGLL